MSKIKGCDVLEMKPYITRLLLPDGEHECITRIYGDDLICSVRHHQTYKIKQSITIKLDNPNRQDLGDMFVDLAIKKYPRPLRSGRNMARDEVLRTATVRREQAYQAQRALERFLVK